MIGKTIGVLLLMGYPFIAVAQANAMESSSVNFHVTTHYQVPQTILSARLLAQSSGKDPSAMSVKVNQKMAWAKKILHAEAKKITWRMGGYQSTHTGQKGVTWRVSESLMVNSEKPDALLALLGTVESRLQLVGLHYLASPPAIRKARRVAELRALHRFSKEAKENCHALGFTGAAKLEQVFVNVESPLKRSPLPTMMLATRSNPGPVIGQSGMESGSVIVGGNAACLAR